jgi:hypothetical protein
MIDRRAYVLLLISLFAGGWSYAADLPVCGNHIINKVTERVGCTVGDAKCWLTRGGFCTDYVQMMASRGQPGKTIQWSNRIRPEDIRKGDLAQFNSRVHYAYIEKVMKDLDGKPVAIDVSEYNYGNCWVDQATLVTDKYKTVNRRSGIPVASVDGGFLRP